jgi:DNA-binding MarR family transcriptional regulator
LDRIESCISFQVGKAAQQVSRRAKELLAPHGVTPVQYAVLKCLHDGAGMSGAELGTRIVLDSASITGVVDRLVALGLVERRADTGDRRVQRLFLTRRSTARQADLDAAMDTLNAEAAHILGSGGAGFARRLRKLGDRRSWSGDV